MNKYILFEQNELLLLLLLLFTVIGMQVHMQTHVLDSLFH